VFIDGKVYDKVYKVELCKMVEEGKAIADVARKVGIADCFALNH